MSGEGGLSVGQVQSIVQGMINPLESELNRQARVVSAMEDEMGRVADAMHGMTRELAGRLEHIHAGQTDMVRLQQSTQQITLDQFQRANLQLGTLQVESVAGFARVSGGLGDVAKDVRVVDGSLQQMSRAIVQMEVIRLLNEAREPVERVRTFSDEIDQRFAKAVENVYFVRSQYDQLLATAMTEYDHKLRLIGEHVYAIYEQDFRQWAEEPLTGDPESGIALPLSVDESRIEARAQALEGSLDELGSSTLEPLLEAHRNFEHTLASNYATKIQGEGDVAVPLIARVYQGPTTRYEVLGGVEVATVPVDSAGLKFTLKPCAELSSLTEAVRANTPAILKDGALWSLKPGEINGVKEALQALAQSDAFEPGLLQGFYDYLDEFGLDTVVDAGGAR